MLKRLFATLCLVLSLGMAPGAGAQDASIQPLLQANAALITESSRRTIQPAIDAIAGSGLPQAPLVLSTWAERDMWQRLSDGQFFRAQKVKGGQYALIDFDTGAEVATVDKDAIEQLKPNSGIRALIGAALVRFQLSDPDPAIRVAALDAIDRAAEAGHLAPLKAAIPDEPDPAIRARKERLLTLLTIRFGTESAMRVAAIDSLAGDTGVDARAALNPLVATSRHAGTVVPQTVNVAATLKPGSDALPRATAYDMLVAAGLAPPRLTAEAARTTLSAHVEDGAVGGVPLHQLADPAARDRAYAALVQAGQAPPAATEAEVDQALSTHVFWDQYAEADPAVTDAARAALTRTTLMVGLNQALDLALDALSLGSIYFLAAIGLAITFGVMGVINMAHGEFIMMGAYTGYVVQQLIPNYTVSILVAIPLAFLVTFAAGVAMERLVIRHLYSRPLETLLATFGISIALQQIAKNIFGTQARPLTSPAWLDGSWVLNDIVGISYIRIAIFALALIFLVFFLFLMKHTRLGLETRAVTQNPKMAASMGINPDRVNMLTFGLGSGIAGIAGVAIGLYAQVTSEIGQQYIVQSFMTVVVGGVGNIWGALLGAGMIGVLQKGIEWFNPSNTLAAQTYMIIFIIIFIQFRPRGIIALKGRAAGD
ncbi:urea ABC transporter permease subunit UrtB [Pseudooceanicola sp. CBS1P-1]|uniref:Urea ABC transporter permease subunit UrtB n=1 Tax=Pseudooceanicola albus TaxID=2692189 RepID=A0A6L7FZS1_9RHOB|nr:MULTISPECIES: urea ABC transporter permease subunit UrtB [Pseudooceanicola]MBT9382629.1 urea ABC transporter permease subunit UrtB [Pseudooceanicola endophyticus]MXN17169.1 urea ABC transporter permease subunit UrtB [Pseudooceanicola albus]